MEAQYEYCPNSTLLINLDRPANEMLRVAYILIFAFILSIKQRHSVFERWLAVIGTPKYFKGKELSTSPTS